MGMSSGGGSRAVPYINVTPLIDVLLVLLIIFMVVTPLKPKRFRTQIPEPPQNTPANATPSVLTLRVDILKDNKVELLHDKGGQMGSDPVGSFDGAGQFSGNLGPVLKDILSQRQPDQRTVFIKAPESVPYGKVVQIIDAVKGAGATLCRPGDKDCALPVGLQVDCLPDSKIPCG